MKDAYKAERFIKERDRAMGELERAFWLAVESGWLHSKLIVKVQEIIDSVPQYPAVLRAELQGYAKAWYRRVEREHICFLYKVDGKFYSIGTSADTGFPSWQTLPREQWGEIGDCGATYWRESWKRYHPDPES